MVLAHAAEQPPSPAATATLNQELQDMKATLLQMQTQVQDQEQASVSAPQSAEILSAQDTASLTDALVLLDTALIGLESSLRTNEKVLTPDQKIAISSTLQGIGLNLSAMAQVFAGGPAQSPVAVAAPGVSKPVSPVTAAPAASAPMAAEAPSKSAPQVAASNPQPLENAEPQMAQVSSVARWGAWGWPVGVGIIIILIAGIWLWRAKKVKPVAQYRPDIKRDIVTPSSTKADPGSKSVVETVSQEVRPMQKPESRPATTPPSSVLTEKPMQASTSMPPTQKFKG